MDKMFKKCLLRNTNKEKGFVVDFTEIYENGFERMFLWWTEDLKWVMYYFSP
ncbi:MAG: hypothetical protein WC593_13665 [Methanoregula sp.]